MPSEKTYRPEYLAQCSEWAKLGLLDREMAEALDVSPRTFARWKQKHNDFCQAVTRGKKIADQQVIRSLFERATGFSYTAQKPFVVDGKVLVAEYVHFEPPSPRAAEVWLRNRQPENFRKGG